MVRKLYRIRFRRDANARVETFPVRADSREAAVAMTHRCWGADIMILPAIVRSR